MTHPPEPTNHTQASTLRGKAHKALAGKHPEHDVRIGNGPEVATAHAALATATSLTDLTDRVLSVGHDLSRIADAAETQAQNATAGPDYTEAELLTVRGEISRTDTKASIMLASVAIVAGPIAEKTDTLLRQQWPITALGLVAVALAGAATWLLLDVVLPRLKSSTNANFLHYAHCSGNELAEALGPNADRRGELATLSAIAEAKYQALARAGALLKAGGALLALTAALAIAF
ncbi:Pycsar system effector family protein [Streptomyces filamentosus]|uniref:Pycsar system effector family protein n=1 Tax=Streptomyces filamentosus TaxID=67294 RepID=UPI0033F809B6